MNVYNIKRLTCKLPVYTGSISIDEAEHQKDHTIVAEKLVPVKNMSRAMSVYEQYRA